MNGRPQNTLGAVYQRANSQRWWIRYRDQDGKIVRESAGTIDRREAERVLRDRLDDRDDGRLSLVLAGKEITFDAWADWFLEFRSKPPFRAPKTHAENINSLKFLRPAFGSMRLVEITAEDIEAYLLRRLRSGRRIHTKNGMTERGQLKPATVHKEYRILRRILNVAVKKKRLPANPCGGVEFPVRVGPSTRKPHYMTASEQERIEMCAPDYLRHIVVLMVETGLRPYRELTPMRREQVDLANRFVHIAESKTANGVADMPLTERAAQAFEERLEEIQGGEWLFPATRSDATKSHLMSVKKAWTTTLRKAGVKYFPLYELRHTFATRLSAGGVADHFVTQMLRQGDAAVFKRYSQAKFNMMREALTKLDRKANEHGRHVSSLAQ